MKSIRQIMQQHAGAWPRDPRAPNLGLTPSREWRGRPFPFPVDTRGKTS